MRLLFFICLLLAAGAGRAQDKPALNPDPSRFQKEIGAFLSLDERNANQEEKAYRPGNIVFTGSSSVRLWKAVEAFPDLPVLNRGFGGSQLSDINYYFEQVVGKHKPSVVVFYAGDNDIAVGKPPQQLLEDYRLFLERMKKELPATRIICLSIKPSPKRWDKWDKAQETNRMVKELAGADKDSRVTYVDVAKGLLGADGKPCPELYQADHLHLTDEGYAIWNEALRPILIETYKAAAAMKPSRSKL